MVIKFGKIELDEWCSQEDYSYGTEIMWYRKLIPYQDYDSTIMVNVRILGANYCYANFYSQLAFLHKYFPTNIEDGFSTSMKGDLEFAKNYVDKFLIRMSGLTAFL